MYLNKAIIIGNLTRDPELRSLPSGTKVSSFGVATNRVWKDQNGARQESTDFHNIVTFGRLAETVSQYMKKGNSIMIEGRIQNRSWDDKNTGEKKYRTEIVADNIQFGPKGSSATINSQNNGAQESSSTQQQVQDIEYPDNLNTEDIPF